MKKRTKTIHYVSFLIIALTILFFVINIANAEIIVKRYSNEFTVSPIIDNSKACKCGLKQETIEINNVGDFETTYYFSVISENEDIIRLSEKEFLLEPKEARNVYVYIEFPCDFSEQTFEYRFEIYSSYGREKHVDRMVEVQQCQNIQVSIEPTYQIIQPCEPSEYTLTIKNIGSFADTYQISADEFSEYITLSEEEFIINPGDEKKVYAFFSMPCGIYGDYTIPFKITSQKNNLVSATSVRLNIEKNYEYDLIWSKITAVPERINTPIRFTLKNLVAVPNTYYLDFDGPEFASVDTAEFHLGSFGEQNFTLNIAPSRSLAGIYHFKLTFNTEYGSIEKIFEFDIEVKPYYEHEANVFDLEYDESCPGTKTYEFNVKNNGLYKQKFEILLDSPSWVKLEKTEIELNPAENANIPITVYYPDIDGEYNIKVTAQNSDYPFIKESDSFKVKTYSKRSCKAIEIENTHFTITYNTEVIPVIVKNTGIEKGYYDMTLYSYFLYPNAKKLELEPGEEKVIHLVANKLRNYPRGKYLHGLTFVEYDDGIVYQNDLLTKLREKTIFEKTYEYLVYDIDYINIGVCRYGTIALLLTDILLLLLLILILTNKIRIRKIRIRRNKKFDSTPTIVLSIVCIILLIITAVSISNTQVTYPDSYYETDDVTNYTALVHVWKENHNYELDISRYFTDPDNDILTYSASYPGHISVNIQEDKAILKPEYGWSGVEKIVFTATDEYGAFKDSPIMTLKVAKQKDIGLFAWWRLNCQKINLVLVLIDLLLILIILQVHSYKRRIRMTVEDYSSEDDLGIYFKEEKKEKEKKAKSVSKKKTAKKRVKKKAKRKKAKKKR